MAKKTVNKDNNKTVSGTATIHGIPENKVPDFIAGVMDLRNKLGAGNAAVLIGNKNQNIGNKNKKGIGVNK